jgi:hypothetical protein
MLLSKFINKQVDKRVTGPYLLRSHMQLKEGDKFINFWVPVLVRIGLKTSS